jgi:tetratricopeptide (TPR) repeat protein
MTRRACLFAVALVACAAACSPEEAKHKAAGNVLFRRGDIEGALREYRAAADANPRDANAQTLIGNALFEKERYDEAAAAYERGLSLDPGARAAAWGLITIYLRRGQEAPARARLQELVQREPRDFQAQAALGKLLYGAGDLDSAERHLREALTFAQNDPAALYALGLTLAKKHDREQARAIFDRLDAATPNKAYAPYGRAVAAAVAGSSDEALTWLSTALARGVDDLDQVERDDAFASLRTRPRFTELIAQARLRAPPQKGSPGP